MPSPIRLVFVFCLFSLFIFTSSRADEPAKVPSLQDAKTLFDVVDYIQHESGKIDNDADVKQQAALRADIYMAASDKLLEIAKENDTSGERHNAYSIRLGAFQIQIAAEIEGAQQKMEAFLDELAAQEETKYRAEGFRFQLFTNEAIKTINTPEGVDSFKSGLKSWIYRNIDSDHLPIRVDRIGSGMLIVAERREGDTDQFATELIEELVKFIQSAECTLSAEEKATAVQQFNQRLESYQFGQFYRKVWDVNSPESFDAFKAELKSWINKKTVNVDEIPHIGLLLAEKCGVPAEQIINELVEYLQSPECKAPWKESVVSKWKKSLLTAFGSDLKLYGRTLDDKDFDWESLRGKHVLVQFTATWCGPCHMEIPGMLEAYKKYHDKGFEIISIYVWERGTDVVASVKDHVAQKQLPWIIISETLTEKAGQPKHGEFYLLNGVPTMLLVDKAGKIIMTNARGEALQTKLAEIFE